MGNSIFIAGILLIFLSFSCNSTDNKKIINNNSKDLIELNDWKKDKEGCLKLRNEKLANKLIIENNLQNGNKKSFTQVFGVANKIEKRNSEVVLIYYFDSVCKEGNIYEKGDKCYANFYFKEDVLKSQEFICE